MSGKARILNLPESMKKTHKLVDGKLVRIVSKSQAAEALVDSGEKLQREQNALGFQQICTLISVIVTGFVVVMGVNLILGLVVGESSSEKVELRISLL